MSQLSGHRRQISAQKGIPAQHQPSVQQLVSTPVISSQVMSSQPLISDEAAHTRVVQYRGSKKQSVRIRLEIGHCAKFRQEQAVEGLTHDWTVYVRSGREPNDLTCGRSDDLKQFVEKVVFHLHGTFPDPKRVVDEPPYKVSESGYGGFSLPIDVYLQNRSAKGGPRKLQFIYHLFLPTTGVASYSQSETIIFENPSDAFKLKLLKGGGQLLDNQSSLFQLLDNQSSLFPAVNVIPETQRDILRERQAVQQPHAQREGTRQSQRGDQRGGQKEGKDQGASRLTVRLPTSPEIFSRTYTSSFPTFPPVPLAQADELVPRPPRLDPTFFPSYPTTSASCQRVPPCPSAHTTNPTPCGGGGGAIPPSFDVDDTLLGCYGDNAVGGAMPGGVVGAGLRMRVRVGKENKMLMSQKRSRGRPPKSSAGVSAPVSSVPLLGKVASSHRAQHPYAPLTRWIPASPPMNPTHLPLPSSAHLPPAIRTTPDVVSSSCTSVAINQQLQQQRQLQLQQHVQPSASIEHQHQQLQQHLQPTVSMKQQQQQQQQQQRMEAADQQATLSCSVSGVTSHPARITVVISPTTTVFTVSNVPSTGAATSAVSGAVNATVPAVAGSTSSAAFPSAAISAAVTTPTIYSAIAAVAAVSSAVKCSWSDEVEFKPTVSDDLFLHDSDLTTISDDWKPVISSTPIKQTSSSSSFPCSSSSSVPASCTAPCHAAVKSKPRIRFRQYVEKCEYDEDDEDEEGLPARRRVLAQYAAAAAAAAAMATGQSQEQAASATGLPQGQGQPLSISNAAVMSLQSNAALSVGMTSSTCSTSSGRVTSSINNVMSSADVVTSSINVTTLSSVTTTTASDYMTSLAQLKLFDGGLKSCLKTGGGANSHCGGGGGGGQSGRGVKRRVNIDELLALRETEERLRRLEGRGECVSQEAVGGRTITSRAVHGSDNRQATAGTSHGDDASRQATARWCQGDKVSRKRIYEGDVMSERRDEVRRNKRSRDDTSERRSMKSARCGYEENYSDQSSDKENSLRPTNSSSLRQKNTLSSRRRDLSLLQPNIPVSNSNSNNNSKQQLYEPPLQQRKQQPVENQLQLFAPNGERVALLFELQRRLSAITDMKVLQRVVEIIEETGQYKMNDLTFDFDLCSLDLVTVRKLGRCLMHGDVIAS